MAISKSKAVARTEAYYDSEAADAFYQSFWGGEDIHIGSYKNDGETIADASRHTVEIMAGKLQAVSAKTRILDLGSGYGGSGRYLARRFGAHVTCLNLSTTQNALNHELTLAGGLLKRIEIIHGDFENIHIDDCRYDIVWSQDAILHSGNRERVLDEVARVLVPGGQFIFTDPMQTDDCPDGVLGPILDRIQLDTLSSFQFYRDALRERGFKEIDIIPMTEQLRTHYNRVRLELKNRYDEAVLLSGKEYVDNMIKGLGHWVDGADKSYLAWGILNFKAAD